MIKSIGRVWGVMTRDMSWYNHPFICFCLFFSKKTLQCGEKSLTLSFLSLSTLPVLISLFRSTSCLCKRAQRAQVMRLKVGSEKCLVDTRAQLHVLIVIGEARARVCVFSGLTRQLAWDVKLQPWPRSFSSCWRSEINDVDVAMVTARDCSRNEIPECANFVL